MFERIWSRRVHCKLKCMRMRARVHSPIIHVLRYGKLWFLIKHEKRSVFIVPPRVHGFIVSATRLWLSFAGMHFCVIYQSVDNKQNVLNVANRNGRLYDVYTDEKTERQGKK